jgi:hypothetical protein
VTLDNRYLPPLLITSILLGAHLSYGILEAWYTTALAIGTAIGAELLMGRVTYGKWPHPASAYISGISAGILVRSPLLWPYFLVSLVSITSKYVLRVRGRHIWNPTNFGVSAAAFLAPATITVLSIQWGNALAPMIIIWVLGSVIVWRVGRAHISATYVASFLFFSWVTSLITGTPWSATVAPITGPMYQLFVFFMVTDPRTTVSTRKGRIIVVAIVALVEAVIRVAGAFQVPLLRPFYVSPPILALAIVGPIAMWWDLRRTARPHPLAPSPVGRGGT